MVRTPAPLVTGLFACFFAAMPVSSQEGHPMTGSWVGDWGMSDADRNRVVVIMEWTGTELTGTINPGPAAIPIRTASVEPSDWSLHIEADGIDAGGQTIPWIIDGTLDDLGTYNRTVAGTWRAGDETGTFSITRQ